MTSPLPVEVTTIDGCALRGQLWPGDEGWIVLVHDVGPDEDLDRWRPLIPSLRTLDVSVCAIDQRGHGASDGEWTDETATGDLVTMVRFARANGAEFVVVVAAGSAAVSALVAAECEPVDGVVGLSAEGFAGGTAPYPPDSPPPGSPTANVAGKGKHCSDVRVSPSPRVGVGASAQTSAPSSVPRAAGTPKLFIVGAHDASSRETTVRLQRASIGWSLIVTLPTGEHGTSLQAGEWGTHLREHITGFVRERRFLARSGATSERGEQ
jgi:pimeloyl-ACP methyl ester carboxylesterase